MPERFPAIAVTMTVNTQKRTFIVIFGSPLFCARERCADLRVIIVIVVVVFEGQSFFLSGARHQASVDGDKNHMRRHTIFCSYCRYYYRMMTVVMTVVTTVATENRMTTHAIFSPSTDTNVGHRFLKKKSYIFCP